MQELVRRDINPKDICILSFTNVAADEIKKRIKNEDVFAGTIHSLANKILVNNDIDTGEYILREDFDGLLDAVLELSYDQLPHFQVLIIDEFQDTGLHEYNFLQYLEIPQVMVIGDPRQRIYGFANKNFDPIGKCLKTNEWVRYTITTNYRCPQNIIDFGEDFIEGQDFSYGKVSQAYPPKPEEPEYLPTQKALSAKEILKQLDSGVPAEEILAREKGLKKRNGEIRMINKVRESEYNEEFNEYVKRCREIDEIEKQHSAINEKGYIMEKKVHINYVIKIIKNTKNYKDWALLCRTNNLVDLVLELLGEEGIPATTFKQSDFAEDTAILKEAIDADKVKVLTMHSSKGLEFNNVAVFSDKTADDILGKETQRLYYVAATRAKKSLYWGLYIPKMQKITLQHEINHKGLMF